MSTEEIQVEQQQPAEDAGDASSTQAPSVPSRDEFYMRYYVGHRGRFGHEFLEFEIQPSGLLRYANDTRYRNDGLIRKEVLLQPQVVREFKNLVDESKIIQEDDSEWPMPSDDGSQELEIVSNGEHISFVTSKIGTMLEIDRHPQREALKKFYYLVQDLKAFVFSLISLHFKIKPT